MGRFATVFDVTSRFEGTIPSDRDEWVSTRIDDVEAVLMGIVVSLDGSPDRAVVDDARLARVKTLVCDKVLDLYRNPARYTQRTLTTGPFTDSGTFASGQTLGISFTEEELRSVRLRTKRSNLGMARIAPWHPARHCSTNNPSWGYE